MKPIEPDVVEYPDEDPEERFYREVYLEAAAQIERVMGEPPSISGAELVRFLRVIGMEELTTRRRRARRRKLRQSRRECADRIAALWEQVYGPSE